MTAPVVTGVELWDQSAERYAVLAPRIPFYQLTARLAVERADVRPGMSVLDLGCGSAGLVTRRILEVCPSVRQIICADTSLPMLEECRKRLATPKVRFVHCPAEDIGDVLGDHLDRVVCNAAIWHFDLERSLRSVRSTLVASGKLLFTIAEWDLVLPEDTVNPKYRAIDEELRARGLPPKPSHGSRVKLSEEQLRSACAAAGYEVTEVRHFAAPMGPQDYELFYRIPAIAARSLPQLPVEVAVDVLTSAMRRLGDVSLPPLRCALFEAVAV
jgi:SAM-dependent methyltransferase